jgi:hypothetical protein
VLFFTNDHCEKCEKQLGYLVDAATISVIDEATPETAAGAWHAWAAPDGLYRYCANAASGACNWLIETRSNDQFCVACRHNRTIPDLSIKENLRLWREIEFAKHHLFYDLLRLRLPLANRTDEPETGLAFDFLTGNQTRSEQVMTGHDNGIITIDLAEADDGHREKLRTQMREPYRTLLGHFRHEVGHYFWDVLVDRGGRVDSFRAMFGDERLDYEDALKSHYADGPVMNWQETFVSAYASSHPWEDFAETWAHYLHIVDTLEMAGALGLRVRFPTSSNADGEAVVDENSADVDDIQDLIAAWVPITIAVNSLNRCMGQPDLYPFVLTCAVVAKLGYILDLTRKSAWMGSQPSIRDLVDAA